MKNSVAEKKTEPTRFQIILGADIEKALKDYIDRNFEQDSRVYTTVIRKAVAKFLREEGYLV